MARLKWDEIGARYVEAGVSKGVLYVMDDNATSSSPSQYKEGVVWNGLTSISENPEGAEPNDLYADNIKYATLISAETFGATIEAYTYPEEFNACDGNYTPTGLSGLYIGQQARKRFGLCYRTEVGSDKVDLADENNYKIHIIYNATATPSDKSYESINDSPDAITFSWEVSTTPINVSLSNETVRPTATLVIDVTKLTDTQKNHLAALESVLYGSDGGNGNSDRHAMLPSPEAIIKLMKDGSLPTDIGGDDEQEDGEDDTNLGG